jgi:hypothetical protein
VWQIDLDGADALDEMLTIYDSVGVVCVLEGFFFIFYFIFIN